MSWALPIEGIDQLNQVIDRALRPEDALPAKGAYAAGSRREGRKSTSGPAPHTNVNELGDAH